MTKLQEEIIQLWSSGKTMDEIVNYCYLKGAYPKSISKIIERKRYIAKVSYEILQREFEYRRLKA